MPRSQRRNKIHFLRTTVAGLFIIASLAFQATSCSQHKAKPTAPTSQKNENSGTQGFAKCPEHFAAGIAPAIPKAPLQRELCYEAFAILHSGSTKTPVFVAERIDRNTIEAARKEQRTNRFFADARLPRQERAELNDYKNSGYARGHMAPAGNMATATAMEQSFSLANMIPQNQKQNSGPWAKIEADTRKYALRAAGSVYVITGPVYGPDSIAIGANKVGVPSHLYKLVYDPNTAKAWAYWQSNTDQARVGKPISYIELKKRIGLDLLPAAASNL